MKNVNQPFRKKDAMQLVTGKPVAARQSPPLLRGWPACGDAVHGRVGLVRRGP